MRWEEDSAYCVKPMIDKNLNVSARKICSNVVNYWTDMNHILIEFKAKMLIFEMLLMSCCCLLSVYAWKL